MPRDRRKNRSTRRRRRAQQLRKALAATEGKIERLYGALAKGTVRKSLSPLEDERNETLRLIGSLEQQRMVPNRILSRKNLARFAMTMRERLHVEDARLRKGYVRYFVERIEVDDATITVRGSKAVLASGF